MYGRPINNSSLTVHLWLPGEAMNQFLNNNAAEIIDEMRPAASVSIGKHFQAFLNSAFTKIPMDLWLTP